MLRTNSSPDTVLSVRNTVMKSKGKVSALTEINSRRMRLTINKKKGRYKKITVGHEYSMKDSSKVV